MNKKKIIITIIIVCLLAIGGVSCWFFRKDKKTPTVSVKQEDIIKGYNYTIKERDSKLKKDIFKELKEILSASEINYDEYAKKLALIFVVDVYDLNSKINKYDVGGLEYILEEKQEDFRLVLQDTLYTNLKDNIDNDRKQELPIVSKVEASNIKMDKYSYQDNSYDAYIVDVLIDYEKDLGYDKNVHVEMIKKEDKLFVVQVEPN